MTESVTTALWGGRFEEGMSDSMRHLSFSLQFDCKLLPYDIAGSQAHARSLERIGVLTTAERDAIVNGLSGILADVRAGKSAELWNSDDEDVHMAVERVLTERIGAAGRKLHTGRSRNDQVATDFKLYIRHQSELAIRGIRTLQKVIVTQARAHEKTLMAGYTHMQQAQPVLLSHYLLSFFWVLERDVERFTAARRAAGLNPLGSGALAGSTFPVDRRTVAAELGFEGVTPNSMDGVAHRDWALEFLSACAILGTTLSRYAEDFVMWSTSEFGYVTFSDRYTSGSSMMPNKKNPDTFELIRGKCGRLIGDLSSLMTTVKGAPLTYSRDLQEDKEPVFDAAETVQVLLDVFAGALSEGDFHAEAMRSRLTDLLLATDLADLLVGEGVPFRDAHRIVGVLVGHAAHAHCGMLQLNDTVWAEVPHGLELRGRLSFESSLSRREIEGGTGPRSVSTQIAAATRILEEVENG